jgi:hypothetical protein
MSMAMDRVQVINLKKEVTMYKEILKTEPEKLSIVQLKAIAEAPFRFSSIYFNNRGDIEKSLKKISRQKSKIEGMKIKKCIENNKLTLKKMEDALDTKLTEICNKLGIK